MSDYLQKCDKLYELVKQFINKNNIYDELDVYQNDRVIANSYDFVADLCNVVGYKKLEDE